MRTIFIPTKYEGKLELPEKLIAQLPQKLVLALPVQYLEFKETIKKQLEQNGKKVSFFQSSHSKIPGQILGCDIFQYLKAESKQKPKADFDAFLYIGDGKFHPTALLYNNSKSVYCYNPLSQAIEVLKEEYLEKLKKQRQARLAKFLLSKRIGLLVTTKPGQSRLHQIEKLREKLEQQGKEVFVFLADEINFPQLEDFNFIESWINTACPRIIEDFNCLNVEDLN